jgi:hypothetical protein
MKKRKPLTGQERKELRKRKDAGRKRNAGIGLTLIAWAERITKEGSKAKRGPSERDILIVGKFIGLHTFGPRGEVIPSSKINPCLVAKYLYYRFSNDPWFGEKELEKAIASADSLNKRFARQMLEHLNKFRKERKPVFDELDRYLAKQKKRFKGRPSISKMTKELLAHGKLPASITGCDDIAFVEKLKKRVKRMPIPPEWFQAAPL